MCVERLRGQGAHLLSFNLFWCTVERSCNPKLASLLGRDDFQCAEHVVSPVQTQTPQLPTPCQMVTDKINNQ